MNRPAPHLTAEELDAIHIGIMPASIVSHLETCSDCRTMVALDLRVVAALATLPHFDPSSRLLDRVMTDLSVRVPVPAAPASVAGKGRVRQARRRVLVGGLVTGAAMAGGFFWAGLNPEAALGLTVPALSSITQGIWLAVQGLSANAFEQPWFGAVRDTLATPVRAVPLLVGSAAAYAATLLAFRRLLTRSAVDAGW